MKFTIKKSLQILRGIGFGVATLTAAQATFADWSVQGSKILDPNGEPFVYRGINLGILPYQDSLPFVFKDIAATGANAVRIPIALGESKAQILKYISLCKENNLVCVLTDTSTYGYGENMGAASYADPYLFWASRADILTGTEDYVVIDMASAPTGNSLTGSYLTFSQLGIFLVRNGGIKNQLIVSGANWGQDWEGVMRDNAEFLRSKDPLNNLVFAVHMYEAYQDPIVIRNYLNAFIDRQFPIIISEFGPIRKNRPNEVLNPYVSNDANEDAIMQISQDLGVGYLGWTWSGYSTNYTDLNMVINFDPNLLTPWGNKLVNSPNGVKATAKLATHFSAQSSSSSDSSSSQGANHAPYAIISARAVQERCGFVSAQVSGAQSTDQDGDPLTYSWQVYDPYYTSYQSYSGEEISFSMRPVTNYQIILNVDDGRGGTSTATKSISHSYSDNCIGSSSSSTPTSNSSSSMVPPASSSSVPSSSSRSSILSSSSRSSVPSSSSRSSVPGSTSSSSSVSATTKAQCSYQIQSQWGNGFVAVIRMKNLGSQTINGWNVNWQYNDGSQITNLWNANYTGGNSYSATNLSWNANIYPGQTVEFGFQGTKSAGAAAVPMVSGSICQ